MNEMMSQPRARHRPTQQPTGASQQQTGTNLANRGASASLSGTNQEGQPNHSNGKTGKQAAAVARETERQKDRKSHQSQALRSPGTTKLPLAADQGTISLLRTVHTKLRGADHDYQGHRVRAMSHVASAIRSLHPSSALNTNVTAGQGNLPQAQSDEILRNALVHLSTAETSLGTGTNGAAHHRNARTSVAEAIHELHTALEIR